MNTELDATIAALQARITAATRERIRAEHARDAAIAARDNARTELHTEFGVSTAAEAQTLLDTLRADLTTTVAQITATLDGLDP